MSKPLVITEKSEVGKAVSAALGGAIDVVACSGHLLELAEPEAVDEARWGDRGDLSSLPIPFDEGWPVDVKSSGDPRYRDLAAKRVAAIRTALARGPERVYCAGDGDDEGQLIVDEVLRHLGHDPRDGRFLRVVINDNTPEGIRRAFAAAKPNRDSFGDGQAARARSLADFAFGANESRLAAARLGAFAAVGRVQTPTLGLVVKRDREVEDHVECDCFSLSFPAAFPEGEATLSFAPGEGLLCEDGRHVTERGPLDGLVEGLAGAAVSLDVSVKRRRENPPLPFSMVTLAAWMSKRSGLTAQDVMDATQSLRSRRLITYNRTDSQYLPETLHTEAPATVAIVAGSIGYARTGELDVSRRSPAFDDSKVTAHHGIVPQAVRADLGALAARERDVYLAIAERYLMQFLPPCVYSEATAEVEVDGGKLRYRAVADVDPGWKRGSAPEGGEAAEGAGNPLLAQGRHDGVLGAGTVKASKLKPPARYTDGTLMTDMSRISKYVSDPEVKAALVAKDEGSPGEKGSIGTTATRAGVIEGLVSKGYLERMGAKLVSTAKGRALYDAVPTDARGVDTTARWWLIQQDVKSGKAPVGAVVADVQRVFAGHMADPAAYSGAAAEAFRAVSGSAAEVVGACPLCGAPMVLKRPGGKPKLACSQARWAKRGDEWVNEGACGWGLSAWCGKRFTEAQLRSLASGKAVKCRGFKGKKGNGFDAAVRIGGGGKMEVAEWLDASRKKPPSSRKKSPGGNRGGSRR